MEKAKELALHEINWWRAHHRRNKGLIVSEMAALYVLLFDISCEDAEKVVSFRVTAAEFHDQAEKLEDKGEEEGAETFWQKAEESLQKHFALLESLRQK